jgi:site-specific recombinase XerD
MGALRERMDKDMVLRGMSPRTRETYLYAVRGLAKHYRKSPDALTEKEVQDYLLHLIEERKFAWSSCNIVVQALKFFYHTTLRRPRVEFFIPRRRAPLKLPEILSREEITALFEAAQRPKHRLLLMTAYAAGLRVSELVHLKLSDIDPHRMSIRVEQGKGGKDRYALLSDRLLAELRKYWKRERPKLWLFPATRNPDQPMDAETAQKVFYRCKQRAGITKRCGIHSLRHAFATHLLETGTDLHRI